MSAELRKKEADSGQKNFWLKLKTKSPLFSQFPYSSLEKNLSSTVKKSVFSVFPKVNFWSLVRPERLKRFALALILCLTVPFCTVKLREYFASFTGPVKMAYDFESEIQNLILQWHSLPWIQPT